MNLRIATKSNPVSWALKAAKIVDKIESITVDDIRKFTDIRREIITQKAIFYFSPDAESFLCELKKSCQFEQNSPLFISVGYRLVPIFLKIGQQEKEIGGYRSFSVLSLKTLLTFLSSPPPDRYNIMTILLIKCYKYYLEGILHHAEEKGISDKAKKKIEEIAEGALTFYDFKRLIEQEANAYPYGGEMRRVLTLLSDEICGPLLEVTNLEVWLDD